MPNPEPEQIEVEWWTRLNQGMRELLMEQKGASAEEADRIVAAMQGCVTMKVTPVQEQVLLYTVEVGRAPVVVFARSTPELAYEYATGQLHIELRKPTFEGLPVWDGEMGLRMRAALPEEVEQWADGFAFVRQAAAAGFVDEGETVKPEHWDHWLIPVVSPPEEG